uniref:PqqA binding protein n=1 Tax=Candidatus Methanophagaceae archaeon ANME-1 ERB6 TaxID=2759912 RepID=A0A7G9YYI2_9EURY|nr:PqqA binding protein [Methanosarcinales archaeon ANME-1 ERB6]
MFSLDNYPHRSDELVWRVIEGEVVILTADGHEIHTLSKVGRAIWELADGTRNIKEIVSLICERFDVSFEVAQADVMEFAKQLVDKKILQINAEAEAGGGDGDGD